MREGLTAVLQDAAAALPANGVGVVQRDDTEHVLMTYVDAFGVLAYRYRTDGLPEAIRPPAPGRCRLTSAELEGNLDGPVEARLLLTGAPDDVRRAFAARQLIGLPLPGLDPPAPSQARMG